MKVFTRERRGRNTFRYERALIPPRVGESAAIISSDEIPERRRRCRGRHADTRTFISQFRLVDSFATVTMCNSFERGRHVSTSRRFLQTRAAYASHHRDRQRSCSKVITPGYVLTIATRTPTMAVRRGEKKDSGTGRPAGSNSGREGSVVHCQCPTIEFTCDQPAGGIGHVVSKLEARGSARREKGEPPLRLRAALCHPALSYVVFSLKNCFFALE